MKTTLRSLTARLERGKMASARTDTPGKGERGGQILLVCGSTPSPAVVGVRRIARAAPPASRPAARDQRVADLTRRESLLEPMVGERLVVECGNLDVPR